MNEGCCADCDTGCGPDPALPSSSEKKQTVFTAASSTHYTGPADRGWSHISRKRVPFLLLFTVNPNITSMSDPSHPKVPGWTLRIWVKFTKRYLFK